MNTSIVRVSRDGKIAVSTDAVPDPAQKKVRLNFARTGSGGTKDWYETWSFAEFKTEFPEHLNAVLAGRKISGGAIGQGEYLLSAVLRDSVGGDQNKNWLHMRDFIDKAHDSMTMALSYVVSSQMRSLVRSALEAIRKAYVHAEKDG